MFPLQKFIASNKDIDLLISGESLSLLFKEFQTQIFQLLDKSKSIIVYRCSPQDKAEVIKFIMNNSSE